jgi:hypothetical protein
MRNVINSFKKGGYVGKVEVPEGYLIFLDNCCNLQVCNQECLLDEITENRNKSAATMGGTYHPKYQGTSKNIGFSLYDPESKLTILSYEQQLKKGNIEMVDERNINLVFPYLNNFKLGFTFIDGVMAADVRPLLREVNRQNNIHSLKENTIQNKLGKHWTLTDMDKPTDILQMYKMIPNLSKSQVHRLDSVHQAVRSMWSPSRDDLRRRITDDFVNVDFSVDDVDLYFNLFPDINAMKGKTQLPEIHRRSSIPSLKKNQVLLSCDVMHLAGRVYMVGIINSAKEQNTIGNIFSETIKNESSKEVTAAVIAIGKHVKEVLKFDIKIEFDLHKSIEFSKMDIENELNCKVEQVSGHVDYAEAAIKMIKQRVRVKNSSLVYDVNSTVLLHIVMGAIMVINRTSRKGNGGRSAHKVLNPNMKTNYKSFYSFSPTDLCEVTTHSSNSTLNLRTTTSIPLHPTTSDNNDWLFYSLETGNLFVRDYKLARKIPWTLESRQRMKYLAYIDPVERDDEVNIEATEVVPVHRYQMPKKVRKIAKRRRVQMETEESGPEPENDIHVLTDSSFTSLDPDFNLEYENEIIFENDGDVQIQQWQLFNLGVRPIISVVTEQKSDLQSTRYTSMLSAKELHSMDHEHEYRASYDDVVAKGSILSVHNNHEFDVDDSYTTVTTYAGALDGSIFATQVSARKAFETFGVDGVKAIETEIQALLKKKVFSAVLKSSLTETQRKSVIRMSCFVRDKVDAEGKLLKIKARLVAGGHMQDKSIYQSSEISSPTVSTSSVFSIISTGISEGRKFSKFDISTAYLNADMPDKDLVHMTLDKQMSEILLKCDDSNEFKGCADEKGQVTVRLKKALYGCVQSAKLWYDHLSNFLSDIGFTANPVDVCVFNRVSKSGKQCTLAIHVDDGMATCEDLEDLQLLDRQIREKFNNEVDSQVNCTKFDYLGMVIDTKDGDEAELTMKSYIEEVCEEHGEKGKAATPAADNLFKLNDDAERLDKSAAERFHRAVAQLLYLATRVRPDILLPITFLCSRVSEPTHDDLEKLHRVMKYLNGTSHLGIVLGKYGQDMALTVYADASYAVHKDCKSHGGIVVYLHRGPVYVKCAKHKMVSKSSTEAELITLSDAVSIAAYNVNFLKAQGYNVCAELKQDNTSTMKTK